jgi:putative membrane protein
MNMTDGMNGSMIALMVIGIALLAATVVTVVWIVAHRDRTSAIEHDERPAIDDPREILRRRYASGEIDEDEYFTRLSGIDQP